MGAMKSLATWVQGKVVTRQIRTPARVDERPVIAKAMCCSCGWAVEATDWSHIPERCPRCSTLLTDKEV